jgi:hypothetical protein
MIVQGSARGGVPPPAAPVPGPASRDGAANQGRKGVGVAARSPGLDFLQKYQSADNPWLFLS